MGADIGKPLRRSLLRPRNRLFREVPVWRGGDSSVRVRDSSALHVLVLSQGRYTRSQQEVGEKCGSGPDLVQALPETLVDGHGHSCGGRTADDLAVNGVNFGTSAATNIL